MIVCYYLYTGTSADLKKRVDVMMSKLMAHISAEDGKADMKKLAGAPKKKIVVSN